jgi:hypothetical protein
MATSRKSLKQPQVLSSALLIEDFFEKVKILTIVCNLSDYHFVNKINTLFNLHFVRTHHCEKKISDTYFTVYEFYDNKHFIEHYIYKNKCNNMALLPEIKQVDFIWLIRGSYHYLPLLNDLENYIKEIPEIQLCVNIPYHKLPNCEVLVI